MDVELKYYCFTYFKALPKYALIFENEFKKYVEFLKKHEAIMCGCYTAVIGSIGECLTITEFESLEQKMEFFKKMVEDEEFTKFHERFSEMVSEVNDYTTKCIPVYPYTPPNPNSMLYIHKHDVKGDPFDAIVDFTRCHDIIYEKENNAKGVNLVGLFYPMYGENINSYFFVIETNSTNALTVNEEIGRSIMMKLFDKSLKEVASKHWEHVVSVSTKIYAPIKL